MSIFTKHIESHRSSRISWLRAAVLGANDGIVSTSSLIVGVAAAGSSQEQILITGIAGLVAGAMSMAAGEYVSVSSQADTEKADLAREKKELSRNYEYEKEELASIYKSRGVEIELARQVAGQLMAHDALGAHARDEMGIIDMQCAKPVQAALTSAGSFTVGASVPLIAVILLRDLSPTLTVAVSSIFFLGILGAVAAQTGGASVLRGCMRVLFWGIFAMVVSAGIGHLFGVNV